MLSVPEFQKKQMIFVFVREGDKLSFSNDNIVVKDKEGKIRHQSTCYRLFIIFIIGNITITSGLLQRAKKFGFSICMMNGNFKVYQMLNNMGEGNTILRKKQYEYENIDIGKHIIENKIQNQKNALMKRRNKSAFENEAIAFLSEQSQKINLCKNINEIMGIEGIAAKVYFANMFNNVEWKGRRPRIKSDYINVILDIGYNLLFNFIDAILTAFGFDTYCGNLHRVFYMRKSLVCDIVEPFRPIIDMQVRKSINLNQFKEDDFELYNNRYALPWKISPHYTKILANVIITNKDEMYKYIQNYYRAFMRNKPVNEFPVFELG